MRNENSYGSITLIDRKSKRRKPYRVQIHVGWTDEGKPIRKTIGYTETRTKGRQLLAEYHDKPFDLDMNNVSFKYLYDKWYEYKKKTNIVESTIKKYKYLRKYYDEIENKAFNEITSEDIQRIIDNADVTGKYQGSIRNLYHQMYEYAKANNIRVNNDVSKIVITKKYEQSKLHKTFTDKTIEILWNNRNKVIDLILIDIYTGMRPGEMFVISEVYEDYCISGSKTEAGRDRPIPFHQKIKPIFHNAWKNKYFDDYSSEDSWYQVFKRTINELNLDDDYTPYDCRHTFATLAKRYNMDEHCRKLIMGHYIEDLTDRVYTHKLIEELIKEVNKIQ